MAKISSFIIALLFVGFFAVVITVFSSSFVSEYSVAGFDNSSLESFDKISELNDIVNQTQSRLEENPPSNILDVLGAFFSNGYESLKLSFKSFDVFNSMVNDAFGLVGLGQIGNALKGTLIAVVLVILLFIIVKAVVKVDI